MHVRLFDTQHNLPSNSDSVEEVVDEAHIVDERVHVAGAEHKQGGQALWNKKEIDGQGREVWSFVCSFWSWSDWKYQGRGVTRAALTVKSKAGMGVQRFT